MWEISFYPLLFFAAGQNFLDFGAWQQGVKAGSAAGSVFSSHALCGHGSLQALPQILGLKLSCGQVAVHMVSHLG